MDSIIERCCGLDVHKKSVVDCAPSPPRVQEVRTFRTMTKDLLELSDWLKDHRVTHAAMESTGVYWKPVYNLLEDGLYRLGGQRTPHEGGAGAQDRREGCRVDRRSAAPRSVAFQLHPGPAPAGTAGVDSPPAEA